MTLEKKIVKGYISKLIKCLNSDKQKELSKLNS